MQTLLQSLLVLLESFSLGEQRLVLVLQVSVLLNQLLEIFLQLQRIIRDVLLCLDQQLLVLILECLQLGPQPNHFLFFPLEVGLFLAQLSLESDHLCIVLCELLLLLSHEGFAVVSVLLQLEDDSLLLF